jgi:hypothetical protein
VGWRLIFTLPEKMCSEAFVREFSSFDEADARALDQERARMTTEYEFADELKDSCKYCAVIGRFKYRDEMIRGVLPTSDEPTATVTFIEFGGRTYAVTAAHVIGAFEKLREKEGIGVEGYFCPAKPGVAILGPFVQPLDDFQGRRPDVAICPVNSNLPPRIGKRAFVVVSGNEPKCPVSHAMATGFPTAGKWDVVKSGGVTLRMQCFQAVADGIGNSGDSDQIQFYSELPQRPELGSLSGLSGGPVFWTVSTPIGDSSRASRALSSHSLPTFGVAVGRGRRTDVIFRTQAVVHGLRSCRDAGRTSPCRGRSASRMA